MAMDSIALLSSDPLKPLLFYLSSLCILDSYSRSSLNTGLDSTCVDMDLFLVDPAWI